ncbi:unnamed protein product [Cyclocybe aegerita]|uniref:Uncharacterized protein n=1 Tax=Cyclocybe aegerita TaxID=1973307 RepID=A0A8S0VTI8_CYCAE|nr:unnamed protein product [Cyclocybe aegerita]
MQFVVATTLAMSASSAYAVTGKFWCNATKGSNADCVLPGVGPTYACGEAQGASGYQSSSSRKYWTNLPSWGKLSTQASMRTSELKVERLAIFDNFGVNQS